MASLRNNQKQLRRNAIFQAAVKLFGSKGYVDTRMEEIARIAGVSVPTVYAYFPSKAELMVALYEADREMVSSAKQALIAAPPKDTVQVIAKMILIELSNGLDYLDADMWRELVASGIKAGNPDYHASMDELNRQAFDIPMGQLLESLQQRKSIANDVDIDSAVATFSDLSMAIFHQQLSRGHPWSWVEDRVIKTVRTVVRGLLR